MRGSTSKVTCLSAEDGGSGRRAAVGDLKVDVARAGCVAQHLGEALIVPHEMAVVFVAQQHMGGLTPVRDIDGSFESRYLRGTGSLVELSAAHAAD